MAVSGVTTFNPDQIDLVEDACTMAGFEPRTGYDFRMTRMALNLLLQEWQNRGLNLWTYTSTSTTLVSGTATYNLASDCVDVLEVLIRTDAGDTAKQSDLSISRIDVNVYASIPTKLSTGRPVQYMVTRGISTPTITFWPIPDSTTTYTLFYYYLRRMSDAGGRADYTMDMPTRFLPALVAGLAYQITLRKPELGARTAILKQNYEEQFDLASREDRDKASVRVVPRMMY